MDHPVLIYRVLRERSAKQYQQIVLEKIRKNLVKLVPFLKFKRLLAPEISQFTKVHKFQENFYANLRLLNDYGLIISINPGAAYLKMNVFCTLHEICSFDKIAY